jgi:hypothetical protein
LSFREKEVLQLIAEGNSSKEIDLHTIPELTKYAIQEGLTTL